MVSTQATKPELQEELRRQGLSVSGTKDELVERLRAHGARASSPGSDAGPGDDDRAPTSGASRDAGRPPAAGEVARLAAGHLASLTGRSVEGVSGIAREDDGWRVEVDVIEVSRIPPTTDVLGTYAVRVDPGGELLSYERVERFVRGQASGGEG